MFTLDPFKLVLVAVVALVVLGPDKLPALAHRVSSLVSDLQRARASIGDHARRAAEGLDLGHELGQVQEALAAIRRTHDPHAARLALYRAAGLETASGPSAETPAPGSTAGAGGLEEHPVPGSIDLRVSAPDLVRLAGSREHGAGSGVADTDGRGSPTPAADVRQLALFDGAARLPGEA